MIAEKMNLDTAGHDELKLPVTNAQYVLLCPALLDLTEYDAVEFVES